MYIFSVVSLLLSLHMLTDADDSLPDVRFSNAILSSSCNDHGNLKCSPENVTACPLGLFCLKEHCKCGEDYPANIMTCSGKTSSILNCYCATYLEEKNLTVIGACVYNCGKSGPEVHTTVTRNNSVCLSVNRTGALCGRCLPDHYPLAYSFNLTCILCPHARWNWVRYIMAAYLPLTLCYLFVHFFKVNVTISRLHTINCLLQPRCLNTTISK